jgi:hypothetical protein
MDRRLKLLILSLFLLGIAVAGLAVYYRISEVPRQVLLLPEGNLLVYANIKPAHLFEQGKSAPARLDPEYRDFVQQTGIQFERDLDEIAISQRFPGAERDTESSAIFAGKFDSGRLRGYLQKISSASEPYADKTIFSIQHEGHLVRAAILDDRTVAVTNMESAEPLRAIIDKYRNPSLAGQGAYLLQSYYRHVPAASLAWIIYRVPLHAAPTVLPGGVSFGFLENTISVTSIRYSGALALKAEIFTTNEAAARNLAESAGTFLAVYRTAGDTAGNRGPDQDVKTAIDSIQVRQEGTRAVFTATVPQGFLRKILPESADPGSGRQP